MSTIRYNLLANNKTNSLPAPSGSSSVLFQLVSVSAKKTGTHGTEPVKSLPEKDLMSTRLRATCGPAHHSQAENSVFLSLQSMQIACFGDLFELQAGFRIDAEGEVWNPVTPELLGWMLARIEIGLRSPTAGTSADLSQAIALFHEARDLSGLEPGRLPSAAWVPPGYGRRFPDLSDPVTGIYSRYQVWRIEGLRDWCGKNAHGEQATA